MTKQELRERAHQLPLQPGVYLHKNQQQEVIYVGKAKLLRNRVSSYFQESERLNAKTRQLVRHIDTFDIIVTESEFEALVLENAMIKKYKPKYNILLKDDKGYPYIRLDANLPYPSFTVVSRPAADSALYFGPYPGRKAAYRAIDVISETLQLKTCSRVFPRDIGKERPCLNQHLGRCCAPCTGTVSAADYQARIQQAVALFRGEAKQLEKDLTAKMQEASEALQFERAAVLRDQMRAIQRLASRQHVVAGSFVDLDAVAFAQGQTRTCVCVLHYSKGALQEKEYTLLPLTESDPAEVLSAFIKQYYTQRNTAPASILLSHAIEEAAGVEQYLSSLAKCTVSLAVPQRGERRVLIRLAEKNAIEELERHEQQAERQQKSLELLQTIAGLPQLPRRLEAYDVSHLSGQDIVGAMVVFQDGQPLRSAYRRFRLAAHDRSDSAVTGSSADTDSLGAAAVACPGTWTAQGQDDYASTREMLTRRLQRYCDGDSAFAPLPDVFLMDGGLGHVHICQEVLERFQLAIPCFGMVKNDKHRTRALIAPDGKELGISTMPALFSLIGRIQEEVHRVAITYHRKLSGKKVRGSTLDAIPGVGEKRRGLLLRRFGSMEHIRQASITELATVVPRNTANAIFAFFHGEHTQAPSRSTTQPRVSEPTEVPQPKEEPPLCE